MSSEQTTPGAAERDEEARAILSNNDRGGYTLPTKGLYPYQWNWDSAFAAIGFSCFDIDRAWTELESLLAHQWPNGMVPHIIFRRIDPDYFPGPAEWGSDRDPPTSGITQPPVAAIAARQLHDADPRIGRDRVRDLLPRLDAWHAWFSSARDPDGRGLVAIIHPWESGRDNLPDWDEPLSHVDTAGIAAYERRDTQHVSADQRPHKHEYDRYMALVRFGRQVNWSDAEIARDCPFWVADVGINAILLRADTELAELADALGDAEIAARARARAERMSAGIQQLWSDDAGGFASRDLRRDTLLEPLSAGAFLPLFGGGATPEQADRLAALLDRWLSAVRYAVPSFQSGHDKFDHKRYWRGPVWAIVNWMIADGFARYDHARLAERIRDDTRALIQGAGFYENFSPITGEGCGGVEFSWTAAIWLCWASPSASSRENGKWARSS